MRADVLVQGVVSAVVDVLIWKTLGVISLSKEVARLKVCRNSASFEYFYPARPKWLQAHIP